MKIENGILKKVEESDLVDGFLKIPDGVKSIAYKAFDKDNNIKTIYIPKSLTEIHYMSFEECKKIRRVEFDDEITSIPNFIYGIKTLASVKLPKNLETVGNNAFTGSKLETIAFPDTVKSIGYATFNSCSKLKSVTLPKNLEIIENALFAHCHSLKKIKMPENVKSIMSSAFYNCSSLEEFEIPRTIPLIEEGTFKGCESLNSISIPKNISEIKQEAFYGCLSLKNVTFEGPIESLGEKAFMDCSFENIELQDGITSIKTEAFANCEKLKSISIPDSVTELDDYVFSNCKKLKNVKLPKDITKIREALFKNCKSLTEIVLPENITDIEDEAFKGCSSLKKLIIPSSVKNIGKDVFKGCNSLNEIFIPNTVMTFGNLNSDTLLFFTKNENGFTLSSESKENAIPLESMNINPLFLSRYWDLKDKFLNEQKDKSISNFYNDFLMFQPEDSIKSFLSNHNFTFYKKICKLTKYYDQDEAIAKLLYALGGLDKPFELDGKKYDYSQKVGEFLLLKLERNELDFDKIYKIVDKIQPNGFKKDFTDFFLKNYDALMEEQDHNTDFVARCYNEFENIQATNTNNHGSQRQLKPTMEKFKDYFTANKFQGTNSDNMHIAREIEKYFSSQTTFDYAISIDNEMKEYNVPKNILGYHLSEENYAFRNIDEYEKEIVYNQSQIIGNLSSVTEQQFTFDWLEKNDPQNFILGKYCSCCAHLEGAGYGIMHASMVDPNVQNLVIRDKNKKIIAKSTLYVNPTEHYGVFNNVEINTDYSNAKTKDQIYEKYIEAVDIFANEYNRTHEDKLYKINVGMNLNDLKYQIEANNIKETNLLRAIDYAHYGLPHQQYSGDSGVEQYIIWQSDQISQQDFQR